LKGIEFEKALKCLSGPTKPACAGFAECDKEALRGQVLSLLDNPVAMHSGVATKIRVLGDTQIAAPLEIVAHFASTASSHRTKAVLLDRGHATPQRQALRAGIPGERESRPTEARSHRSCGTLPAASLASTRRTATIANRRARRGSAGAATMLQRDDQLDSRAE
jgi:hypothetical protein